MKLSSLSPTKTSSRSLWPPALGMETLQASFCHSDLFVDDRTGGGCYRGLKVLPNFINSTGKMISSLDYADFHEKKSLRKSNSCQLPMILAYPIERETTFCFANDEIAKTQRSWQVSSRWIMGSGGGHFWCLSRRAFIINKSISFSFIRPTMSYWSTSRFIYLNLEIGT